MMGLVRESGVRARGGWGGWRGGHALGAGAGTGLMLWTLSICRPRCLRKLSRGMMLLLTDTASDDKWGGEGSRSGGGLSSSVLSEIESGHDVVIYGHRL